MQPGYTEPVGDPIYAGNTPALAAGGAAGAAVGAAAGAVAGSGTGMPKLPSADLPTAKKPAMTGVMPTGVMPTGVMPTGAALPGKNAQSPALPSGGLTLSLIHI